ncbi:MAG: NADH-quinone oxidoreductase subunit C, partial [Bradyrhizobium sp.]
MSLIDRIPYRSIAPSHRPWPRAIVGEDGWQQAIELLAAGEATLLGFWGEPDRVHLALFDEAREIVVVSFTCASGQFPSVGVRHPPAQRLERAIRDLFGLEALGAADRRPWLDHGVWGHH